MQFVTAGLQHGSAVVQYVLPAVRERLPTQAADLVRSLQASSKQAGALYMDITSMATPRMQSPPQQQGQGSEAGPWQQLLLSPHLLPCMAAVLVMVNAQLDRSITTHCAQVQSSSATGSSSSSSSSNKDPSSGSSIPQPQQQHSSSSGGSSSGGVASATFTTSQLQLLQLLGLAPETAEWAGQELDLDDLYTTLLGPVNACSDCIDATWHMLRMHREGVVASLEQQQRWPQEQLLWQLLSAVLLPCASSLLLPGAPHLTQAQAEYLVQKLLLNSTSVLLCDTLTTSQMLPLPAALAQEYLGVLLKLADRLLHQQAPALAQTAAAAVARAGAAAAGTGAAAAGAGATASSLVPRSSTSLSGTQLDSKSLRTLCAEELLTLLYYVYVSLAENCRVPRGHQGSNDNSCSVAACSSGVAAVPPLAAMFVEGVTALEAAVRATSEAAQSTRGIDMLCSNVSSLCSAMLLPLGGHINSVMVQHIGLCGSSALDQQQRQLYSFLSTLQKLPWCVCSAAEWSEQKDMAAYCSLAAASAALELLQVASAAAPAATDQRSQTPVAAAVPSVSLLPSLVIAGRNLHQFVGQLQQHSPELLALQVSHGCNPLLLPCSAARVHMPWLGSATLLGKELHSWRDTVSEWLGGIDAPAHAQLAAAGCSPLQLQQQLGALLSAVDGTHHSLTGESLAALVQHLQATGAMLCSIAVPHFCNNAACVNLSGPTELLLVSGRSCICAGCRIARYCGRDCQRAAWKQHKPVCKALAATAATAATAAGT